MTKPKVGFYWCASCGGCEEAVVDLAEDILKVVEAVDIVFWPVALDFKREDVEKMADGEMAVCFVNGAVRTSEQQEMAELCRRKARMIVAFGSCSHTGGIPGLANLYDRDCIFQRVYRDAPSVTNPEGTYPQETLKVPEGEMHLPSLHNNVHALDQTIDVDYYLPGCPPPVQLISGAVTAILKGELPPKGSTLAPNLALCHDCARQKTKPDKPMVKEFKRPHQVLINTEDCILAQGILCMGPATRTGCDAACVSGNMPCTGCLGPLDGIRDQGAKSLSAIASVLDATTDAEIGAGLDKIPDPAGTFYRYTLPWSLLHRRITH